jgi:hypothetical protein
VDSPCPVTGLEGRTSLADAERRRWAADFGSEAARGLKGISFGDPTEKKQRITDPENGRPANSYTPLNTAREPDATYP